MFITMTTSAPQPEPEVTALTFSQTLLREASSFSTRYPRLSATKLTDEDVDQLMAAAFIAGSAWQRGLAQPGS